MKLNADSKFFLIALFFLIAADSAFAMGSDSKTRTLTRRCREFRDALQTRELEKISPFLAAPFKQKYEKEMTDDKFFQQKPRLITKIIIPTKYHPRDLVILPRARFRVFEGVNGDMVCKAYDNGEKDNPAPYTVQELRLIEEAGEWKVASWKLNEAW